MIRKDITPVFSTQKDDTYIQTHKVRLYATLNFTYRGTKTRQRFPIKNLSTGKSYVIKEELWNRNKRICYVRGNAQEKQDLNYINNILSSITFAVQQIVKECITDNIELTPSHLSASNIYSYVKRENDFTEVEDKAFCKSYSNVLVDFWVNFIERAEAGLIRHNGNRYGKSTIISYRKCLNRLLDFQQQRHQVLTFEDIDQAFYNDYVHYMENAGLMLNTRGEQLKKVKHIMKIANLEGYTKNSAYEQFSVVEEEVDNVYLTLEELKAIKSLELVGEKEFLDKYRDMFLVGCYTGLRVSDLMKLGPQNRCVVDGIEMLKIRTQKTEDEVSIPFIFTDLKRLLDKYEYHLPKITEQNLRDECRRIARMAGIDTPVHITAGRLKRDEPYEKWETISIHTCRRTFCTLLFKKGVPKGQIMMVSGHKKEASFDKYIKMTKEENAVNLARNNSIEL